MFQRSTLTPFNYEKSYPQNAMPIHTLLLEKKLANRQVTSSKAPYIAESQGLASKHDMSLVQPV